MIPRPATPADLPALARLHAAAFESGWSEDALRELIAGDGASSLVVEADGAVVAFLIARLAADEAEIVTLAVDPAFRRRGLGGILLRAALESARTAGARALFLEVATDNPAAVGLYEKAGFLPAGRRRGYYARAGGARIDALVLRYDLTA